jgi:hypothetical protein
MEHPLYSVRETLVPSALVSVKVFSANTEDSLELEVASWIAKTQNLVVCPGPVNYEALSKRFILALTYVAAVKNNENRQQKTVGKVITDTSRGVKKLSAFESDGRFS